MELHILGTGSKGNCSILEDNGSKLLIDCGIRTKQILSSKYFTSFKDFEYLLVTHNHKDHNLSMKDLEEYGINIINTESKDNMLYKSENWVIKPFLVQHSIKCQGFIIKAVKSNKTILWATDFFNIPVIDNCDIYCIEANYDRETNIQHISKSEINRSKYEMHFSLEQLVDYFSLIKHRPEKIITLHASKGNLNVSKVYTELNKFSDTIIVAHDNLDIIL